MQNGSRKIERMRIIACDDDKNVLMLLEEWVKEYMGDQHYQYITYTNGIDLIKDIGVYDGDEPQILFMDVKLKNDNGIDVAKILNKEYGNIAVIFISGYTEYLEDSFEADPVYFLVKPLKKEIFEKAMKKAIEKVKNNERKFLLIKGKEVTRVFYDEIYFAESVGRKMRLYCEEDMLEYYEKMDELEKELKGSFVRCHKSFLVNLMHVRSVDGRDITLMNGKKIPISRNKSAETKEKVFAYLGGLL